VNILPQAPKIKYIPSYHQVTPFAGLKLVTDLAGRPGSSRPRG